MLTKLEESQRQSWRHEVKGGITHLQARSLPIDFEHENAAGTLWLRENLRCYLENKG